MQILHPVMPFITEEIWHKTRFEHESESIMISEWPEFIIELINKQADEEMAFLQETISAVRNIRGEMNVPPGKMADVHIRIDQKNWQQLLQENQSYLTNLAKVKLMDIGRDVKKPPQSASAVVRGIELFIPLEGLIDIETEKTRLQKEITRLEDQLEKLNQKLSNQNFVGRAPKEVVEKERQKKQKYEENLEKFKNNLVTLT